MHLESTTENQGSDVRCSVTVDVKHLLRNTALVYGLAYWLTLTQSVKISTVSQEAVEETEIIQILNKGGSVSTLWAIVYGYSHLRCISYKNESNSVS